MAITQTRVRACCRLGRYPCHAMGNLACYATTASSAAAQSKLASDPSCLPSCVRACYAVAIHRSLRFWHTPPRPRSPSPFPCQCHRPCPGRASRARPPTARHSLPRQRVLQTETFSSSTEPSGARLNFQVVELPEPECMHLRAPATTRLRSTPTARRRAAETLRALFPSAGDRPPHFFLLPPPTI
jgi:hypothetical protein